ncbi:DNA polymerase III subunit delta [Desulfuribacillus stibiiarsenatis]|uniref:DNA polymerase III subunit delta n=1 Tax=Desulfuribacillus stibiiarsenatis TaxID=1390249 RepID=A0A1E5L813_9FIRM|nr:DNA polymerase III subunit delta [Desulfuribacillus stibiiarsenatis]OEH86129.1 DNA polymerase III subunit delta [Desulfuribacillus stibiiarsenatis]
MSNVYLLFGNEAILMEEWLDTLIHNELPDGKLDMNYSSFDLEEIAIQQVLQYAETIPFMADRKIVIAERADFFGTANGKNIHDLEALNDYLLNPAPYTTIIFKTKADKLDKRKKIAKTIEKAGIVKGFVPLQGKTLEDWILAKVRSHQCTIDGKAVEQLIVACGSDMNLMANEIEKLCLYVNQGNITSDTVALLVSKTLEQNLFAFIDRIAQRNIKQGLQVIYDLLKNKESPILIFFLLAKKFRTMLVGKDLLDKGYSPQQIATQLGQHPYALKITLEQGAKFSPQNLRRMLIALAEADEQIKTGKMSDVVALERFILSIPTKY